jgi:hypothetical protein
MRFSEFTESKKLNEVAPAVAIAGVTFTAAELTALLVFGGSLAAMMTAYNADPEGFASAYGNPAATVASAWQETQDLANEMMGNETDQYDGQSFDEANAAAQARASSALGNILATNQKLTPDQRTAISAMPSTASAIPAATASDSAEIEKRSAEIRAQVDALADAQAAATAARSAEISAEVDRAADARNAAAATNAVRPDATAAGMPAAKAPPVNAVRPDATAASMPAAKAPPVNAVRPAVAGSMPAAKAPPVNAVRPDATAASMPAADIPAAPEKNDVDITSDLPDVTSPPKTRADIARGGADTAPPIVGAPPGMTLPGITGLGVGAGVAAGLNAITGAKADAIANTKTDNKKGGGRLKGKWDLPGLPNLPEPPGLGRIAPKLINLNDPLNLKRNA